MTEQPRPETILQHGFAFWGSKALLSAIELDLFSHLAKGPQALEPLRCSLSLHERSACDFFDALVALGLLQRIDGKYANTPETELYLDRAKPSYIGGFLDMCSRRLYSFWGHLTEALRSGEPQNESKSGQDLVAAIVGNQDTLRLMLRAMSGMSRRTNQMVATKFAWQGYKTFVDVGAAQGDLAVQIAQANPHITGAGFDLPGVGPIFREYIAETGTAARLRFVAGDFFVDDLPPADVVTMGHILHDWDLPTRKMLIGKAHKALPKGGALVIYDSILDDDRSQNVFGLLSSLNMLIETKAGSEYTGADCRGWMEEAGFHDTRVEHLAGPESMVVGIK